MTFEDYDKVLLAGRPVRPEEYAQQDPDVRWNIWTATINQGLEIPPLYPGSIEKPCEMCGIGVQVGPRQQQKIAEINDDSKILILCLIDASLTAAQSKGETTIHDLGNPYKEHA